MFEVIKMIFFEKFTSLQIQSCTSETFAKTPKNVSWSKIRLFRTLEKHSGQSEQINCFITETPNYSPKTNITKDLESFH